jgi:glycosyltransferase involved in cell wall biosynthesis
LNERAEAGAAAGVTRYLLELYRRRPDLQQGYPDLDGEDGRLLVEWAWLQGRNDIPIPVELLPPALGEPVGPAEVPRYLLELHERREDLQRAFPDPVGAHGAALLDWARSYGADEDPFVAALRAAGALGGVAAAPKRAPLLGPGVNVVGYLGAEMGLAEAARAVIAGLDANDYPVLPVDRQLLEHDRAVEFQEVPPERATFPISVLCLNPRQAWRFRGDAPPGFLEERHSIGLWWWEIPDALPIEWWTGFGLVDEIWAGSDTVAQAVGTLSPKPVKRITLPVLPPRAAPADRRELGLPEGRLFLLMFDHDSSFARKNPLAAIEAFCSAFRPGEGAALVIKTINSQRHPAAHERLERESSRHPDIHVLDGMVSAERRDALLAACDCGVSLHRAEGFGLPLAQTMCLGKPVIATGYSGNLEFMKPDNSYLVRYELTQVGEGGGSYYPHDFRWAEPDPAHAAELMRKVFDDPEGAAERGRRAAEHMSRVHSPSAGGRTLVERLDEVRANGASKESPHPSLHDRWQRRTALARAGRLARRRR